MQMGTSYSIVVHAANTPFFHIDLSGISSGHNSKIENMSLGLVYLAQRGKGLCRNLMLLLIHEPRISARMKPHNAEN